MIRPNIIVYIWAKSAFCKDRLVVILWGNCELHFRLGELSRVKKRTKPSHSISNECNNSRYTDFRPRNIHHHYPYLRSVKPLLRGNRWVSTRIQDCVKMIFYLGRLCRQEDKMEKQQWRCIKRAAVK